MDTIGSITLNPKPLNPKPPDCILLEGSPITLNPKPPDCILLEGNPNMVQELLLREQQEDEQTEKEAGHPPT